MSHQMNVCTVSPHFSSVSSQLDRRMNVNCYLETYLTLVCVLSKHK